MKNREFYDQFRSKLQAEADLPRPGNGAKKIVPAILSKIEDRVWEHDELGFLEESADTLQHYKLYKSAKILIIYGLTKYPNSEPLNRSLAAHHLLYKEPNAAIKILSPLYENIKDRNSKLFGSVAILLGEAFYMSGETKSCISVFETLQSSGKLGVKNAVMLAETYVKDGNCNAAIDVLEQFRASGAGGNSIAKALSFAHLQNNDPLAAISLLEPHKKSGLGNDTTAKILCFAYVATKNRHGFDLYKDEISQKSLRDYLNAKLFYFENNSHKALEKLQPYVQGDIRTMPFNIVMLYMACIGDESPVLKFIKAAVGEQSYNNLIQERNKWREDPMRADLQRDWMASAKFLFELGANPVSAADRSKAGLGREVPVHIRQQHNPR